MEQFEISVDNEIVLRLHQEKKAPILFNLVEENRTYFREWLSWLDYNTKIEDTEKFISESKLNYQKKTSLNLGIYFKNELVGTIGYNSFNKLNNSASIGYMLGEKWTGRGIVTKSCKAIIEYGFNVLKLNSIEIKVAVENFKSRAIPKRLGFKKEGVIEEGEYLDDDYVDLVVYVMLKENWKNT